MKDFSERILCNDGNCIGVINEKGFCNICRKTLGRKHTQKEQSKKEERNGEESMEKENENILRNFEVFELKPGGSEEDIKEAYKDLTNVWNPDRFPNDPQLQQKAMEKLKGIDMAYEKCMSYTIRKGREHNVSQKIVHSESQPPPHKPPFGSREERPNTTKGKENREFQLPPRQPSDQPPTCLDIVSYLRDRLKKEKKYLFEPTEKIGLPEFGILSEAGLDFIGIKKGYGLESIGFVKADMLTEQEITNLCEVFDSFNKSIDKYSGRILGGLLARWVWPTCGSVGLLCFVFEKGCTDNSVNFILSQKISSTFSLTRVVFWVLDVENRKVYTRHGASYSKLPPGDKYIQDLLYDYTSMKNK